MIFFPMFYTLELDVDVKYLRYDNVLMKNNFQTFNVH